MHPLTLIEIFHALPNYPNILGDSRLANSRHSNCIGNLISLLSTCFSQPPNGGGWFCLPILSFCIRTNLEHFEDVSDHNLDTGFYVYCREFVCVSMISEKQMNRISLYFQDMSVMVLWTIGSIRGIDYFTRGKTSCSSDQVRVRFSPSECFVLPSAFSSVRKCGHIWRTFRQWMD